MIRPPLPADQGYIASTWSRSMMSAMRAGHAIRRHGQRSSARVALPSERDLRELIGARIDAVLDRPDTRALVSVLDGNWDNGRDFIVGWILYVEGPSVPVIHYAYCRDHDACGNPLRGRGVVRDLLHRVGVSHDRAVVCTSEGPASDSMRAHFKASVHVPLAEFLR